MKKPSLKHILAVFGQNAHKFSFVFLATVFVLPFFLSPITLSGQSIPSIPSIPGVPLPGGGQIISIPPQCNPFRGIIDQGLPSCTDVCRSGNERFTINLKCNTSIGIVNTAISGCENVCPARGGGGPGGGGGAPGSGSGAVKPFGGKSEQVTYCTCSDSILHKVGPPVGGNFVYVPGQTTLYQYYQIYASGVQLLGNYQSGGQCLVYRGNSCEEEQVDGTMTQVGTSKSS